MSTVTRHDRAELQGLSNSLDESAEQTIATMVTVHELAGDPVVGLIDLDLTEGYGQNIPLGPTLINLTADLRALLADSVAALQPRTIHD